MTHGRRLGSWLPRLCTPAGVPPPRRRALPRDPPPPRRSRPRAVGGAAPPRASRWPRPASPGPPRSQVWRVGQAQRPRVLPGSHGDRGSQSLGAPDSQAATETTGELAGSSVATAAGGHAAAGGRCAGCRGARRGDRGGGGARGVPHLREGQSRCVRPPPGPESRSEGQFPPKIRSAATPGTLPPPWVNHDRPAPWAWVWKERRPTCLRAQPARVWATDLWVLVGDLQQRHSPTGMSMITMPNCLCTEHSLCRTANKMFWEKEKVN